MTRRFGMRQKVRTYPSTSSNSRWTECSPVNNTLCRCHALQHQVPDVVCVGGG